MSYEWREMPGNTPYIIKVIPDDNDHDVTLVVIEGKYSFTINEQLIKMLKRDRRRRSVFSWIKNRFKGKLFIKY